jgi:hypothetical protein
MSAATGRPQIMSTIITPHGAGAVPSHRAAVHSRYLRAGTVTLLLAETVAIAAFVGFWTLWIKWQTATPWISRVSGDFVSFYTAGELVLAGRAVEAYAPLSHYFQQLVLLHSNYDWGYLAFFYPPFFLFLCAALALLPYFPALCIWLGGTCLVYAGTLRALMPNGPGVQRLAFVLFLGYPALMANIGFGQNGFLSAGLFGGAAMWLERRPVLAGLCFGCLAYKPQLGIVVPLALAAAGRWRAFTAAAATVLALMIAATAVFGADIWPPFFAGMSEAKRNWMEPANPYYLRYWVTVYGALRLHGASLPIAYGAQLATAAIAFYALVTALRRRPPQSRNGAAEIAAIAACVPFCSPFMLEYDLVILAVPMAWILGQALRDGFRSGEPITLAAAYLAPALFKLAPSESPLRLVVIATSALLFATVLRRIVNPCASADTSDPTLNCG